MIVKIGLTFLIVCLAALAMDAAVEGGVLQRGPGVIAAMPSSNYPLQLGAFVYVPVQIRATEPPGGE